MICDICKRKIETIPTLWIISMYDLENVSVCKECNLCLEEQFFNIIEGELLEYYYNNYYDDDRKIFKYN